MRSLKEEAQDHEPCLLKNVAELKVFDINIPSHTFKGTDSDGEPFSYKYIQDKDGVKYRVAGVVLGQIKDFLEVNPNQTLFSVKKTGEGLKTRYTTIPVLPKPKAVKKVYEGVKK